MERICTRVLLAGLLLVSAGPCAPGAFGQPEREASPAADRALVVAVREAPPFAMRDPEGNWVGLSVDLWQDAADKLDWNFEWREMSLAETLAALETGEVDVGVAALTITPDRERALDFSHPYYVSGLALAYQTDRTKAWLNTLRAFLSWEFLSVVLTLAAVLLVVGALAWLFERRRNREQFGGGGVLGGLGAGFWWSAVTMTTVGYGDKAPLTLGGRVVALIWMFASLVIIASFTGAIAASVTVSQLETKLLEERRLAELRIGVLGESAGAEFLRDKGIRFRTYDGILTALEALDRGEIEVVAHDAPILKYYAREREALGLEVTADVLVRDDYGYGLPPGSSLREPLDVSLLTILHEPAWEAIKQQYLGESARR
jgi:ABC-type amino acid transport substrate-binding protein